MDASVTKKSVDMNFKNKKTIILPFQLGSTAQSGASVGGLLSNGEPTRLGFKLAQLVLVFETKLTNDYNGIDKLTS